MFNLKSYIHSFEDLFRSLFITIIFFNDKYIFITYKVN